MKNGRPIGWPLAAAAVLTLGMLIGTAPAEGQVTQAGRGLAQTDANSYIPAGKRLTSAMVRDELERRIARIQPNGPTNEAALWNVGYDFFRNFPGNQDTAMAIKNGFLSVRTGTAEQRTTLRKAAIYWEKIHDYGIANVPVGQDFNSRGQIYYGDPAKFSTLPQRQPGRQHQGFSGYDWPGRNLSRREPHKGRPDNPYPGKYYPGAYPP